MYIVEIKCKKNLVTILRPVDICHQLNSSMHAAWLAADLKAWGLSIHGFIDFFYPKLKAF